MCACITGLTFLAPKDATRVQGFLGDTNPFSSGAGEHY
ncbi:phage tail fiber C-terminal domain-containing protein [Escherichia coli]